MNRHSPHLHDSSARLFGDALAPQIAGSLPNPRGSNRQSVDTLHDDAIYMNIGKYGPCMRAARRIEAKRQTDKPLRGFSRSLITY